MFNLNFTICQLEKYCQENDIKYVDPKINYAYHTGLLSEIVNKLEVYFANLTFSFPKLDVYSPILGRFINQNDVGNMAHILSVELIKPFSFRKSIEKLYNENEANVYVECGPGHILANYVNKILNRSFIAINSNEPGKRSNITFDNTYLLLDFLKKQKEMCFVGKDNTINEIEKLTGYPQKLILQLLESPTIDNKLFAVPNNIFNKIQLLLDKEDNNQFRQKNVVNVKDTNIKNKVVNVISSETGYPKEMLDIDADLEADLGIDSVKLGEILSRLAAESGIELSDDQQIHTIGDIIKGYKGQNNNESVKEEEETNRKENNDNKDIQARIIEIISDETGYPKEVLDTDADLEADLGIDSVKLGEILSRLAAESGIELSDDQQIHTIGDIIKGYKGQNNNESVKEEEETNRKENNDNKDIQARVIEIISDETGYPKEVLDTDADLEADLGIDSVKLGEILSRLAAESGIELSDDQQIHTIGDIIKGYKGQNNNESVKEEEETNRKENNDNKDIQARVIEIISDETGYPKEVLDTDADLEADLGIDSVKLGEILSRLAAESGIELSDDQQIHTIHDILKQCVSREDCSVEKNTECNASIHRYAAEKVEYPLKKENNIDISSFNVLLIGSEKYSLLTKKVYQKLRLKVKNILYIDGNKLHQTRNIKEFLYREFETSKFKCNAIVNLSSLDTNDDLNESFEEWNLNDDLLYETLFYSVKYYYNDLAANGYLISIVSTDNSFGISNNNIYSPSLGIVTGFTKGLEKELRPFKAKVIGTSLKEDVSSLILEEFNKFGNAIEISYENEKRYKLITIPQKLKQESENIMVGENDTVLATGGGKGITYELLKRLCEVTDCNAVIIGRSDFPDGNEKWLTDNSNELEAWKKEFLLSERKKNPDKPLTEITFEIDRLIKSRDLYKNINNLRKQGFNIEYMKCDISKEYDVKKVSDKLREKKIQITGIINGAGLPSFGKLPNKNEKLAKKVVTVKANSLYLINKYFLNDKVKFLFSMGSISGRFGMDGQTDYSAGADVLVKISKLLAYKYPKLNCKVIGWPAWEKVGMASNPEVIKVQKEERGLDYISINEGQDFFIDELMNFDKNVEFLYFGKLGKLNMPLGQLDNVDLKKANLINEIIDGNVINKNEYPLVEKEKAKFNDGIEVSWNLNKNAEFLNDHRIRKNKVLAGVYQVEFALETCKLYCENHGIIFKNWTIDQFEFINFVKVFERNVELRTQVHVQNVGNKILFEGNIISDFVNKNGYCLIKDKIFSTFKISLDKNEKVNVLDMMEKSQVLTTKSNINLTNYYDKLDNFIHFGKGFRCLKEVINEGKMATGIVKVCDEALEINRESTNMIINPILVDNMGRLMLINEFEASGYSIVPISLHGVRKVGNFVKNNEVYAKVIKIANSEKDCEYKAVIESKDGTVLFKVDNMRLAKIDQITND